MKTMRYYFWTLFIGRWFVTTFALLALLSFVDSVGNADILPEGAGLAGALKYTVLRLPALFDRIFMFALFVSLLLTYVSLIRRHELVSMVAMRVSPLKQIKALAPIVILVTVISGIVIDQSLPRTASALDNWLGVGAILDEDATSTEALWIAEDSAFVEIGAVRGAVLTDIAIYQREGTNAISSVTRAAGAEYERGVWKLQSPETVLITSAAEGTMLTWQTAQTPETLQKLGTSPRNLSVYDQYRFSSLRNSGTRPASAYQVWAMNRLTMPIVALGFVLVSIPLMQQFGRRQTGDQALMLGIAIAFVFFILDGVLKIVAESGGVTILTAIGLPIGLLFGLGIYLSLEAEQVG